MKTTFIEHLNALVANAENEIRSLLEQKKTILLFEKNENDGEDEWTKDIHYDVPDFQFYDKHGYSEAVAIKEIRFGEPDILIIGVCRGNNFPAQISITLSEMDCYSRLNLADYLLSEDIERA